MSAACDVCLGDVDGVATAHPRCPRALFGADVQPEISVSLAQLHTAALAMVGKTTLSGVQRKLSLGLAADRRTLQVAVERARFILKPEAGTFPALPANEHVTTCIAELFGDDVPPCALVRLSDGSRAFLAARFDRPVAGGKQRMEDFCQLAEKRPKEKYDGSAEACVRLVRRFASEPGVDVFRLFRRLVVAWMTGNGDMHLKNLALLGGPDGRHRLSPAFDLVSTRLVIPGDAMALPVVGKRDRLRRAVWLKLAAYARLPERAAARVLAEIADAVDDARTLVARSALPDDQKRTYRELLEERASLLTS